MYAGSHGEVATEWPLYPRILRAHGAGAANTAGRDADGCRGRAESAREGQRRRAGARGHPRALHLHRVPVRIDQRRDADRRHRAGQEEAAARAPCAPREVERFRRGVVVHRSGRARDCDRVRSDDRARLRREVGAARRAVQIGDDLLVVGPVHPGDQRFVEEVGLARDRGGVVGRAPLRVERARHPSRPTSRARS